MQKNVNLLPRTKDITGNDFGRLTVISFDKYERGNGVGARAKWNCVCTCGNLTSVLQVSLQSKRTQSCGCLQKEKASQVNTLPMGEAGFNSKYYDYKLSAKKKKLPFKITKKEAKKIFTSNCFYCGIKPKQAAAARHGIKISSRIFYYNGIDRRDNKVGYVSDNCVPCCSFCNMAKRAMSVQEFSDWIHRVATNFLNMEVTKNGEVS